MGDIARRTMKFLIPLSVEALATNDLTGRSVIPMYINPQSVNISETKLIQKTLTKGGYVIQYWGEDLPKLQVSGTTGSGGIEAIEILRDVYRHEQIQFERIILDRARQFALEAEDAITDTSSANAAAQISTVLNTITAGGFSSITDGVSSVLESIQNAFQVGNSQANRVELIPTLAAFAVSIDLYFQGEKFRGYFTDFQVNESAESPGLFDYTFNFEVLKRTGKRKNFMPWHRNPRDLSGQPRSASIPKAGAKTEELNFPSESATTQEQIAGTRSTTRVVVPDQSGEADINNVGVNRFSKLR